MSDALWVLRVILNLIGLWPLPGNSSTVRIIQTKMLRILSQALLYFIFVPGVLQMFLKESNARRRIKIMSYVQLLHDGTKTYIVDLSKWSN